METSIWNTIGLEHEQVECESHIDLTFCVLWSRVVACYRYMRNLAKLRYFFITLLE